MTRVAGPDCAFMCNLIIIKTHTHTHTQDRIFINTISWVPQSMLVGYSRIVGSAGGGFG